MAVKNDGFVMTLDSDSEDIDEVQKSPQAEEAGLLDSNFSFDVRDSYGDLVDEGSYSDDLVRKGSKPQPISVDDIIARQKISRKRKWTEDHRDELEQDDSNESASGGEGGRDWALAATSHEGLRAAFVDGDITDPPTDSENYGETPHDAGSSSDEGDSVAQAEKDRKAAFFDSDIGHAEQVHSSFMTMNLSRPILKALTALGFHKPTPIQSVAIPVALLGKDIVGGAVTGSGKTAAFIIPMLERLLYRDKSTKAAATRCLVLVPTRELAVQCFEVGTKLATHTDVQFCLIVGGLSVKSQEVALRGRPDVVIATPGRLIDHVRNSPSFSLDNLDILVLDEADRMLSDGFADELTEIVKFCPTSRQTMLFSATMTDSVDELVGMSLKRPVRLFVDPKKSTARGLVQEFVRVRAEKEAERSALLVALCKRSFKTGVIIFFRSKKLAHQMRIVFTLLNMKCEELHGDLSQEQRLNALKAFRNASVNYLMATDLAARGLDIKGIETVINYDMPAQLTQYLHRVGRTARAGQNGRSVTLVGEFDRKMLKAAVKHAAAEDRVRHRVVPAEAVSNWAKKLDDMREDVVAVLQEEREEKELRRAEMELKKGQNMAEHEVEIYSRPVRTWFQSSKEKQQAEAASRQDHESGGKDLPKWKQKATANEKKPKRDQLSGLSRKAKRRKLAMKEDQESGNTKGLNAAIRSAKRAARPVKIGTAEKRNEKGKRNVEKARKTKRGKGSRFDHDMTPRRTKKPSSPSPQISIPYGYKRVHISGRDKDLVILVSRLGGKDRLALWKIQGSKQWEVDVASDQNDSQEIVDVAWSPDAQTIVVAHDPPCITLHSVQDGRQEGILQIQMPPNVYRRTSRITRVSWFKDERIVARSSIPDIFRRKGLITGSALSILRTLPLLDHLQDDSHKPTATDLFAFQGSHIRPMPKSAMPEVIKSWPTLLSDPLTASIAGPSQKSSHTGSSGINIDDVDDSNVNSILAITDNIGCIHFFLDGNYPLGSVSFGRDICIPFLVKDPKIPRFYIHPRISTEVTTITDLQPVMIDIPLLSRNDIRAMANLSTTASELMWYIMRVVKEMRHVWFGSDTHAGARELGPKWIRALETKQKDQFGQEDANPILDLTSLLVTGRASEALMDFLGSADQISERGIQKWETTVTEALMKLRDFSEKRAAPACQRLHLLLEELRGWSLMLPRYALFDLPPEEIEKSLELTGRAIIIASWLASVARRELTRFKEFISWLKYETAVANPTNESHPPPKHDILEVNNYFMSGLVVSSIDKWFMGPVPRFTMQDLGIPSLGRDLSAVLERSRKATRNLVRDPIQPTDFNHLDRNLDALTQELAVRCQQLFSRASGAASRSATFSFGPSSVASLAVGARPVHQPNTQFIVRERVIMDNSERGGHTQHLAIYTPSGYWPFLCLARTTYGQTNTSSAFHIGVELVECCLGDELEMPENKLDFDILDLDFFDDESIVVVLRLRAEDGATFMATVGYNDLGYRELRPEGYVILPAQEDLMEEAMQQWKAGHVAPVRIPINRRRRVSISGGVGMSVAVNGRVGRRVACLLNEGGTMMESFDLEGDGDDIEGEEPDDADGEV